MIKLRLNPPVSMVIIIGTILLVSSGCKKPPVAEFSYSPSVNPEMGDSIKFLNESEEALTFEWEFGDGMVSSDEHPFAIYETTGSKVVNLTATNEAGSTVATKTLTINEPTILGFIVFESDTVTVLENCEIWVYDNQFDFEELNEPQFIENTDNEGIALFMNLEAQSYYVIAYKETDTGYWIAGGSTASLSLNQLNAYSIICEFVPDEVKKKSLTDSFKPGNLVPVKMNLERFRE
ncbi:MAG: PKD domain-containing protein [Bacteroidales bacterium]